MGMQSSGGRNGFSTRYRSVETTHIYVFPVSKPSKTKLFSKKYLEGGQNTVLSTFQVTKYLLC
jgi:hypothetical protein